MIFTVWKLFEENILLFSIIRLGYYFCLRQKKNRIIFKLFLIIKEPISFTYGLQMLSITCRTSWSCKKTWTHVSSYFCSYCNVRKWPKALFQRLTFSSPFSMMLPWLLTTCKNETRLHLDLKLKHCKNASFLATWFLIPDREHRNKRWPLPPN